MVKSNVMESSANSNAMIQDNSEGLMEKNDIHIQRKNYRSGNTKEQNCLNTWDNADMTWEVDSK